MAVKEHNYPAPRYVILFVLDLLASGDDAPCRTVHRSDALPAFPAFAPDGEPVAFERFRNRLKVMANLDPVTYPSPRTGQFLISVDRQIDGQWYDCRYTIHLRFDDAAPDPSVELRVEPTSKEPTVSPDLCL